MGVKIYNWLTEELSKEKTITAKDQDTACLIGLRSRVYQFQPVEKLKAETDFKYRRWYVQHFLCLIHFTYMLIFYFCVGIGNGGFK